MKTFLNLISPQIPAVTAERLAAILKKRRSMEGQPTPAETQQQLAELIKMIQPGDTFNPAFVARLPQDDREIMQGDHFNGHMEAFEIDIHNLYAMTNNLTGATLGLQRVLRSRMEALRAQLCRLSDDVLSYQQLKNTDGYARVITQGFADARNATVAGVPARVDPQTRSLKLPTVAQRRYHQERGIAPSQVIVSNLSTGLDGVASRTFEPENAIDPDPESFWADVLLASGPLQTDYTDASGVKTTYPGALAEIRLVLGAPQFVSDVKILPFGDYPVRVVDVKYSQSGTTRPWPAFVAKDPSLNWLEWHGERVLADEVIFVIQQETYTKVRYHIPKWTVAITSFWEQLLDEEERLTLSDQNLTDFQIQKAEADSHFASLYEGLRRYGLELERLDIPKPDPDGRTISDAEVLNRTVEAAAVTLTGNEDTDLRLTSVQSGKPENPDKLIEVERYEYLFGAREIQANDFEFVPEGHYQSPRYAPDSTILKVRVNPVEEHPTFTDASGTFRRTSIAYDVEIAPGRRVPVLPKGQTAAQDELLIIDRVTRSAVTRFPVSGAITLLRKNGEAFTNFGTTVLSDNRVRIQIAGPFFSAAARYSVTYTAVAGSDAVDVDALYDSVLLEQPESFLGTDDTGSVELKLFPYVEYGVVNDELNFKREAMRSAKWFWVGGATQSFLDGIMYGNVNTSLTSAVSDVATTIPLGTTASLSATGNVQIGTEVVSYTGTTPTSLTGVTRGVSGTAAQSHPSGQPVVGERIYEPVIVHVGDVRAFNITDYLSGRHPAFLAGSDDEQRYEFLHIGRRLYFNRPIADRPITVRYRWMNQYVQVHATLRSHSVARVPYTPTLRRFHAEIESSVL